MKRLLIVAPHHDDESIGCGGTMIKEVKQGSSVFVVVLTSGGLSQGVWSSREERKRERETLKALKSIGIPNENIFFLKFKERDNFVNFTNTRIVAKLINDLKITDLYFPHSTEMDADHRKANKLTQEALFLSRTLIHPTTSSVKRCYEYEVWTPLKKFQKMVDISDVARTKNVLLKKYTSQNEDLHIATGILGLNRYRGFQAGCVYAEVYKSECI